MIKVENGKITQTTLPLFGYVKGRFVSRMASVDKKDLLAAGWYEPVHEYLEYDPVYEKLSSPTYTYDKKADTVTATYTVIDRPEAVLKRRVDELEAGISAVAVVEEEVQTLKAALIEKEVLWEADIAVKK